MKKVLFLCLDLYTYGGIQRVMSTLLRPLADCGNLDITVMMPYAEGEEDVFGIDQRIRIVNEYDFPYYRKNTFRGAFLKALQHVSKRTGCFSRVRSKSFLGWLFFPRVKIQKISEYVNDQRFDCVVGVGDLYIVLVSLLDCEKRVKRIGWNHSTFEGYFRNRGRNCFGLVNSCINAFQSLDFMLVLTSKDKAVFEAVFHKPAYCLQNPVRVAADLVTASSDMPIVFCGRMEREVKGLDYLLEIITRIHEKDQSRRFVLIGGGPDEKWLRDEIHSKRLDPWVEVTGKTNEVDKYYQNASLLIHTSRWEGFGLVILEAMAYGIPVVAFHNNGPDEIIENGADGFLIERFHCSQFAETVLDVLNDPVSYALLSANAKQKSRNYSPEILAEKLRDYIVCPQEQGAE